MVFYVHVKVSSSPLCPLCMTRSCIFDWWLCTCMYVVCRSVTVLLAILLFRLRWKGRSQGTREEGADPQCQVLVGAMEGAARTTGKGLTRVSLNCSVRTLLFGDGLQMLSLPSYFRRGVNHYCKVCTLLKFVAQCLCLYVALRLPWLHCAEFTDAPTSVMVYMHYVNQLRTCGTSRKS